LIMDYAFSTVEGSEEKKKELKELKALLEEVLKKLEKLEMPETWIKKGIEKVKATVPPRRKKEWEESWSGYWR